MKYILMLISVIIPLSIIGGFGYLAAYGITGSTQAGLYGMGITIIGFIALFVWSVLAEKREGGKK